jgi:hypothetical protein
LSNPDLVQAVSDAKETNQKAIADLHLVRTVALIGWAQGHGDIDTKASLFFCVIETRANRKTAVSPGLEMQWFFGVNICLLTLWPSAATLRAAGRARV